MSDTVQPAECQALAIIAAACRGPGVMCLMTRSESEDTAPSIVAALREAGYVIVPREATAATAAIGVLAIEQSEHNFGDDGIRATLADAWRVMVDASEISR